MSPLRWFSERFLSLRMFVVLFRPSSSASVIETVRTRHPVKALRLNLDIFLFISPSGRSGGGVNMGYNIALRFFFFFPISPFISPFIVLGSERLVFPLKFVCRSKSRVSFQFVFRNYHSRSPATAVSPRSRFRGKIGRYNAIVRTFVFTSKTYLERASSSSCNPINRAETATAKE